MVVSVFDYDYVNDHDQDHDHELRSNKNFSASATFIPFARLPNMFARSITSAVLGLTACPVHVEVRVGNKGRPKFAIVGLGDNAIHESKARILAALHSCGFEIPPEILVNLAPAEIRKEGSGFDLPIALAILACCERIPRTITETSLSVGELSLNGAIKKVRGVVPAALMAARLGIRSIIVPRENSTEASILSNLTAFSAKHLLEVVRHLQGEKPLPLIDNSSSKRLENTKVVEESLSDVIGQKHAKRGLLIAASGGHNALLLGPPGCGKTMLANRFTTLLPSLSYEEVLEAAQIQSIAGLSLDEILTGRPAFRAPHHTTSEVGLIGGGNPLRPGEVSLAHHGVLFLDELPEFKRPAIESLRTPLESRLCRIVRSTGSFELPASFQLLAAMNLCPCGQTGKGNKACSCSDTVRRAYVRRVSQPLLDRIDIHLELESLTSEDLLYDKKNVSNESILEWPTLVDNVRQFQINTRGKLNRDLHEYELREDLQLSQKGTKLIEHAMKHWNLSARGYLKVIRVARTIADLENSQTISDQNLAEALQYRTVERLMS